MNYLVYEKGIPVERLIPKGLGETTPATIVEVGAGGDTTELVLDCNMITKFQRSDVEKFEYYHQLNRRTECVILSFDYVPTEASSGTGN